MIHYIVACYLGSFRRNWQVSQPETYIRRHLEFISRSKVISSATIVISADYDSEWVSARAVLEDYSLPNVDLFVRDNHSFSYGAWNEAIVDKIQTDAQFFMLIEDDYIPTSDDALLVFSKKFGPGVGYVCSKVTTDEHGRHAGMSIGMMSVSAARDALSRGIDPLKIDGWDGYRGAEWDQVIFLENIESMGYTYTDIASESKLPFVTHTGSLLYYGNQESDIHIRPIFEEA